jgi:hypothetical protein
MRRSPLLATAAAIALLAAPAIVQAAIVQAATGQTIDVGVASAVNPAARGLSQGRGDRILFVGYSMETNERIVTSDAGRTQVLFVDQSSLTVGPNSDMVLDKFVYDPDAGTGAIAATVTKGVFRYVGGKISKASPVEFRTPTATIGIRGGVGTVSVDGATGATTVMLHFGRITVTNGTGVVREITAPGFKVVAATPNLPPAPPERASVSEISGHFVNFEGSSQPPPAGHSAAAGPAGPGGGAGGPQPGPGGGPPPPGQGNPPPGGHVPTDQLVAASPVGGLGSALAPRQIASLPPVGQPPPPPGIAGAIRGAAPGGAAGLDAKVLQTPPQGLGGLPGPDSPHPGGNPKPRPDAGPGANTAPDSGAGQGQGQGQGADQGQGQGQGAGTGSLSNTGSGTGSGRATSRGGVLNTGSNAGPGTGSGGATNTGSGAGPGPGTGGATNTGSGAGPGTGTGGATNTGSGAGPGPGTGGATNTGSGTGPGTGSGGATNTGSGTGPGTGTGGATNTGSGTGPGTGSGGGTQKPASLVPAPGTRSFMVTFDLAPENNFLPAGVSVCDCQFLSWGYKTNDAEWSNTGPNPERRGRLSAGAWVTGDVPAAADIPTTGTASYAGHAIGDVDNQGARYLATGTMDASFDFARRTGLVAVSNFDGRSFSTSVATDTAGGRPYAFGGAGNGLKVNGAFARNGSDPVGGLMGQFLYRDPTASYTANGIIAGRRK